MIWNLIRWPLGQLILLADFLTSPRSPRRDPAEQAQIDIATRGLALYQFRACPFCVKTRRAIKRLGLNIELRDARNDPEWRQQLLAEGGRLQVPCLYIPGDAGEARWLYESNEIIAYLEERFSDAVTTDQA
ncbi:MAG: glutaredoxin [Sedimenticolaceae bacterium]